MAMLPKRSAIYVFSLLLSGFMTFVVSGVTTLVALGAVPGMPSIWMRAWITAWIIAFPALLVIRPLVHRLTAWLTDAHAPTPR
jgi:hypothetical protein